MVHFSTNGYLEAPFESVPPARRKALPYTGTAVLSLAANLWVIIIERTVTETILSYLATVPADTVPLSL